MANLAPHAEHKVPYLLWHTPMVKARPAVTMRASEHP